MRSTPGGKGQIGAGNICRAKLFVQGPRRVSPLPHLSLWPCSKPPSDRRREGKIRGAAATADGRTEIQQRHFTNCLNNFMVYNFRGGNSEHR